MALVIAFEGIAGTGKTTVSRMLAHEYPDTVEIIDEFPQGFINDYMRNLARTDPEFRLSKTAPTPLSQTFLFATNAAFKIETARHSQKPIVIMDRYKHSITAHQSIILAEGNTGIDHKRLLEGIISSLPDPDIIIYFQGDIELMKQRLTNRSDIYNESYFSFIAKTHHEYQDIMADSLKSPIIRLPASNTIEENYEAIRKSIFPMVNPR